MLTGRVAVITGAGRGIGRSHALLFARLGAKVVVNDLGGSATGNGTDPSAAQTVVDEIIARGGEAVATTDSVADFDGAKRLVDTAVATYGNLHVLVNNAGILRDKMLVSMTEAEFDAVVAVHLKGTFNTTRHAAAYWRERAKDGDLVDRSIVNTSSGSGLHGNVGQTNYAAAKAGIAGMTLVHAKELARYQIRVNGIAPIARTRLTEATPGFAEQMDSPLYDPEHISPLVAYLATEHCRFNGQMFGVYGGAVGIYARWSIAEEVVTDGRWTAEELGAAMEERFPAEPQVRWQLSPRAG